MSRAVCLWVGGVDDGEAGESVCLLRPRDSSLMVRTSQQEGEYYGFPWTASCRTEIGGFRQERETHRGEESEGGHCVKH